MHKRTKVLAFAITCTLLMSQTTIARAADISDNNTKDNRATITNVRAQDDFYDSVNKDWLNTATIKDGQATNSSGMEVYEKVTQEKKELINDLVKNKENYSKESDERKIANLYENYMNTEERNKQGMEPVKKMFDKIKSIKSLDELNDLDKYDIYNPLIKFACSIDLKDSDHYALYIYSSSLCLGDSDQYTKPTDDTAHRKEMVTKFYINILKLAGYTEGDAKVKVENMFKVENMLAPSIMGQEESSKDDSAIDKMYNVVTIDELDKMAPNLKIKDYMKNSKVDNANKIILTEPKWLQSLNDIYKEENLQLFKDYIEIKNLASVSSYLGEDFEKVNKEFSNEYSGAQGEISKEEKAIDMVNSLLEMPLGKAYVNKYFDESTKTNVEDMIKNIVDNYKKRIEKLDWMSDETKANAKKKLDDLKVYVGYPDKWEDYSDLQIKSYDEGGSLIDNVMSIEKFENDKELAKLNTTVDKDKMGCSPQTVDACYQPLYNSITIPAGILQAPMYDVNGSKEQNYGAIGTVIGHEISHAFDNSGAKFDSKGNLNNWWKDGDYSKFKEKTQKVRDFYSTVKASNGKSVNGDLTVGENIADISGVRCSLDIVKNMDNPNYKDFFESYAKIWRFISTPEVLDNQIQFDVHSPSKVRVNAVLSQIDEFYTTYGITPNDKMYVKPEDRLQIW